MILMLIVVGFGYFFAAMNICGMTVYSREGESSWLMMVLPVTAATQLRGKILFSMMRIALGGAVIMLVSGEGGKSYQGLLIYAVATYTFYKLGMAIRNMIKVRKEKSLLLVILRNISYADALVSLLSLQTALFVAFGQDSGELIPLMNALTSAGVCLMILGIGIYMVRKSKKLQISYRSATDQLQISG